MKKFKTEYGIDNFSGLINVLKQNLPKRNIIGCYFLYDENKNLIYIGKALSCISSRLNQHLFLENTCFRDKEFTLYKRPFYKYFAFAVLEKDTIKAIEKRLIIKFKPKFNVQYNDSFDYTLKYKPISEEREKKLLSFYLDL